MALFEKIVPPGVTDIQIPILPLMAAFRAWADGNTNRAGVIAAFNMDASDEAQLDWLKGKYDTAVDKDKWLQIVSDLLSLGQFHHRWPIGTYNELATFQTEVNNISV